MSGMVEGSTKERLVLGAPEKKNGKRGYIGAGEVQAEDLIDEFSGKDSFRGGDY